MHRPLFAALLMFAGLHVTCGGEPSRKPRTEEAPIRNETVATFSIVACDLEKKEWGVAVQSRVLAVGAIVPFAEAEIGTVATQSSANTTFGPRGLKMLADGKSAQETLDALIASDEGRDIRQVGIIDKEGRVANYTGKGCNAWAGAKTGKNYSVQGNILASEEVVTAMAKAFEETEGTLADRMIASLAAGQKAGGDTRGQQSAGLLVMKKGAGYGGFGDKMHDLRVDDHEKPIDELKRIFDLRMRRTKKTDSK